ncbi:MAG: aminotransferase class III-fold pyridoxal phosphate-dependent enzyme [Clostridiales bacterium]|jgi:taurine--2-oxoglutarate transaminase|nr:aminotransferase class III-fold pyridoxal phosphate-dependent enzyme [Clostridiales bacterium]
MSLETLRQAKINHTKYNMQSWTKQGGLNPLAVAKAEGIYIWDENGTRYTDMSSQLVNLNLGHGNRAIVDAIKKQADAYCYISPSFASEPRGELAKMLVGLLPPSFGKVFFTNGGADANENALKIARQYTGRDKVFSRYRSYHGSTFGAGNLTGEPRRYPLEPGIPGFVKFFDPYVYREVIDFPSERAAADYYVAKLREQIIYEDPAKVAAIFLESITGSNGIIIPPAGYMQGVRAICDEFGIMLVCDEVMTGFGRTGKMFGFENFGIVPDIVSFAKGVTCGYVQLGGVAVTSKIAAHFDDRFLSCGLTYSGHPLACAAGLACVKYYADNRILQNVSARGAELKETLTALQKKHKCVGDVRSIGLFAAVELVKDKKTKEAYVPYGKDPAGDMGKVVGALKAKGFLTYSHENNVIVAPPLIITKEQLAEELVRLDEVLSGVDASL